MPNANREPISIKTAVYSCLLGGIVILVVATGYFVPGYLLDFSRQIEERDVALKTRMISIDLARSLHADWNELRYLAGIIEAMDQSDARNYLNGMVGAGNRISWAGYAGSDGTVRVASGGLLENVDVSARPWFRGGLRGGFSGDVHEAVLLQNLLGSAGSEPLRFIDLAVPVVDADARTVGVLSLHINFGWVTDYLSESAAARSMDVLLLSADGTVAATSIDVSDELPALAIIRAATAGTETTTQETWPDGRDYISAAVPDVVYEDLPSFGWRLIGRIPATANSFSDNQLLRDAAIFLLATCMVFTLAAIVFVAVYIDPITRLAEVARRISLGEDVYPPETHSSREASRLGAALARLQSRSHDMPD